MPLGDAAEAHVIGEKRRYWKDRSAGVARSYLALKNQKQNGSQIPHVSKSRCDD